MYKFSVFTLAYLFQKDNNQNKLFVGGISRDTTDDEFKAYFDQFGPISDCVVIKDNYGVSK